MRGGVVIWIVRRMIRPAMPFRTLTFVIALLACALGGAAIAIAQTPAQNGPAAPSAALTTPIEFYLAHGAANACGRGCDEWIAAEGKIDLGAVDRLRQLLKTLKDRRPPIYFRSPGGNLNGSLLLGRLIRDKKFEVSVGNTIPIGCSSDKKADNSCESRKRSGQAIEAEISATAAQCNSACVYAVAAGTVRLVPPGVPLGIHDAGLDPNAKLPNGVALSLAIRTVHTRLRSYLREMGIDDALFEATLATPYESVKALQRDDLVRFGIDRRESGETEWQLADKSPPYITKRFFVRADGDQPHYVDGAIDIGCQGRSGFRFILARQPLPSDPDFAAAGPSPVGIAVNGRKVVLSRTASSTFYARIGLMALSTLDAVGDDATIELPGSELGRKGLGDVTLNMDGFAATYAKLKPRCSPTASDQRSASWSRLPQTQGPAGDARTAALVHQLPSTKEAVSDPRTAAWLLQFSKTKGAPPGSRAAAVAPKLSHTNQPAGDPAAEASPEQPPG
jgi:hypothetical protein